MIVNKSDLITLVAKKAPMTLKEAGDAVEVFLEEIQKAVGRGDMVKIFGFGVFRTRPTVAREVKIPGTETKVKVKAGRAPAFTPGTGFKRAVR